MHHGREGSRAWGLLLVGVSVSACAFALNFDGLEGGPQDRDAGDVHDGSPDSTNATPEDANVDSCSSGRGSKAVRIPAGCIDTTEVTNAQYLSFLTALQSESPARPPRCEWKSRYEPASAWPPNPGSEDMPVGAVDWCAAYAFCKWAGKHLCGARQGGALPTAAFADPKQSVWYSACTHDGDGLHRWPYGNGYEPTTCNTQSAGIGGRSKVGVFTQCRGGYPELQDMSGNVAEWEDSCDPGAGDGSADQCRARGGSFYLATTDTACDQDIQFPRNEATTDLGIRCCSD